MFVHAAALLPVRAATLFECLLFIQALRQLQEYHHSTTI